MSDTKPTTDPMRIALAALNPTHLNALERATLAVARAEKAVIRAAMAYREYRDGSLDDHGQALIDAVDRLERARERLKKARKV